MSKLWKTLDGWAYEVSSSGQIRNLKSRVLRPATNKKGYLYVLLCRNGRKKYFSVHRLVAAVFIGPCPEGKEVNHKDAVKSNNAVFNLEYCTHEENIAHAVALGIQPPTPTHCSQGHSLSGTNLMKCASGRKRCRKCGRAYNNARPKTDRREYYRQWKNAKKREAVR